MRVWVHSTRTAIRVFHHKHVVLVDFAVVDAVPASAVPPVDPCAARCTVPALRGGSARIVRRRATSGKEQQQAHLHFSVSAAPPNARRPGRRRHCEKEARGDTDWQVLIRECSHTRVNIRSRM